MPAMTDAAEWTRSELEALLRWHVEAGAEDALDAIPHDRFADSAAAAARAAERAAEPPASAGEPSAPRRLAPPRLAPGATPPSAPAPASTGRTAVAMSAEAANLAASQAAAAAMDLDALRAALEAFEGCTLKRGASRLCFADGDPSARVMLVGEAPGAEEDREGRPFVGRAGRLLDLMLGAIGLDRGQVYIANVVPWRPPGNRTPTPHETAACLPFIRRQIELANPDILVCLGAASTQTLLGVKEGIMRARGRAYEYSFRGVDGERTIAAFATLHPAYLLRQPLHKKQAWADLRALRHALDRL
jgi:DNA polymerase